MALAKYKLDVPSWDSAGDVESVAFRLYKRTGLEPPPLATPVASAGAAAKQRGKDNKRAQQGKQAKAGMGETGEGST